MEAVPEMGKAFLICFVGLWRYPTRVWDLIGNNLCLRNGSNGSSKSICFILKHGHHRRCKWRWD